jgi:tetratricopeptide (TPR) repeat protein
MRKKEGLAIAESVAVDARALKYRPLEAQALITLGTLQTELGDAEKARHTLEEGVLAAVAGRDARDEVYGAAAMEHLEAGLNHIEQGEAWEKRGEAAMEALGGSDLDPLATLLQRAADIYSARGEFEKALERDRRLLAIREKNDGPDSVATSVARVNMGRELVALGRFPEAKPLLLRGVAGLEKELGPTHVNVGWALITLATAQSKTGRRDECIRTLQRAVEIYDKGFGPEHSQLALPLANLGTAYLEAGKYDEGVAMLRRSRDITAKTLGPDHPFVGLATLNIGNALLMQDKYEAAQEQFARALTILQKGLTPDHSLIASALASNAIADVKLHHAARALPVLERTLTMPTQNAVDLGQRRFWLASALWDSGGDRVRARKLAQQARTECASGGEDTKKDVTEIDAWIAAHH